MTSRRGRRGRWRGLVRNPFVLGGVCSVGAGMPPLLTEGWPLGVRLLVAVPVAGLAGAAGSFYGVTLARRDLAAAASQTVQDLLDPLIPPESPDHNTDHDADHDAGGLSSVMELLLPDRCPTRFWGRRAERDRWWSWCQDQTAAGGLLLVQGPAGCGKTRLAIKAAEELQNAGWLAGWLPTGNATRVVQAVAGAPARSPDSGVLVLVDDADTRTDLEGLLEALGGYTGPTRLRVALIARHGADLGRALAGRVPERHAALVARAPVMTLAPLGGHGDLVRSYNQAVQAFAAAREVPPPPVSPSVAPVRAGQPLLEVMAHAMAAVLRHTPAAPESAPLGQVAGVLFEHEARWWRATARLPRWAIGDATDELLARVMTVLVLLAPADESEAIQLLQRIPDLVDASRERLANLVRWAHALYLRTTTGFRVGPDLLADWFVTTRLTGPAADPAFTTEVLTGLTDQQAGRVLTTLARAADRYPPAHRLFQQVLNDDPVRLFHHAIYAALRLLFCQAWPALSRWTAWRAWCFRKASAA